MQKTTALDKLKVSIINFGLIFVVVGWLLFILPFEIWKFCFIACFFVYQIYLIFTADFRSLGMKVLKIYWNKPVPYKNRISFAIFYTFSFSTVFLWVIFPFDILIFNLLFVQLPMIMKTGRTLHAFLSGGIYGVKYVIPSGKININVIKLKNE